MINTKIMIILTITFIYSNLQQGYVIFSSSSYELTLMEKMLLSMNDGTTHVSIVIEDGKKYLIHAYPIPSNVKKDDYPFVLSFTKVLLFGSVGPDVYFVKEPLLLALCRYKQQFHVFRTNRSFEFSGEIEHFPLLTTCTNVLGPLLAKNGIIPVDKTLFFKYRPDYILNKLYQNNYPSFRMMMV